MATPEIVLGREPADAVRGDRAAAARRAPSRRLYPTGFPTILIAHIMFNISFVVVTVKARLAGFDRRLEEAAMDLGANELTTFWKVTFPLILPGIMAAALLAFSLSIDDFVITNFVSGHDEHVPDLGLLRSSATRCRSRSTSSARSSSSAPSGSSRLSSLRSGRAARIR